jgi:two-component system sensor histidine kinase RegB
LELATPTEEPSKLSGSLSAISQALRNLLGNALEASGPTGAVRLSVSQNNGELAFSVQDDGPGMPAAVVARATEPFFTTKPRGQGMGLGLFLAQSVAEQMGGRLELSSVVGVVGSGTRAVLVLPIRATNSRMPSSAARSHTAAPHG